MDWKRLQYAKPEQIKAFQDKKLAAFMRYQAPYSPFYRELFKKEGLKFSDITTTDDLTKLPFTSKADIAPTAKEPKKARTIILQPNKELLQEHASFKDKISLLFRIKTRKDLEDEYKPLHLHLTTGRTALPTVFMYTMRDLVMLQRIGQRMLGITGVSKGDIAVNAFPYAPHLAFWQTAFALMSARVLSLQTGGGKIMGTKGICKSINGLQATVLVGIPSYIYHLLKVAKETKIQFKTLKYIVLGGERVPLGLRTKIQDILRGMGAKKPTILSTYAFTEGRIAWPQCHEKSGYHLYPDLEFVEIVDKKGKRVEQGERGEIVYTALDWRGSVVLRYKTGDIGALETGRCPYCHRTVPRVGLSIERSSEFKELNLEKIKGTLVNLNTFYPIFMGHVQVKEWQLEIRKKNNDPYELDELIIYVAPKAGVNFSTLKKDLVEQIRTQTEVEPNNIIKCTEAVLRKRLGIETELKEKRIIDNRKKG